MRKSGVDKRTSNQGHINQQGIDLLDERSLKLLDLCSTPEKLKKISKLDEIELKKLFSKETLNHVITAGSCEGESLAFHLSSSEEGLKLLTRNKHSLGELISKKGLNAVIPKGSYKGESVLYRLSGCETGRNLLANCNFRLASMIAAEH